MLKPIRTLALLVVMLLFRIVGQGQSSAVEPESPGAQGAVLASANAARLVKFSGTIRDRSRQPLTGTIGVTIAIYREQQGGTPLWLETQNVQLDAQGNYSVLLGSTESEGLPLELFSTGESRWLGIQAQVPGEIEQPRVLLVSVPYALKAADADKLGGKPFSAFLLANPDNTGTQAGSTIASGQRIVSQIAAAVTGAATTGSGVLNKLPKWDATGINLIDSAVYENGGLVGIGTSTPGDALDVNGSVRVNGSVKVFNTGQFKFQAAGDSTPRYQMGVSGVGGIQFQSLDAVTPRQFFLVASSGVALFQYGLETGNLTDFGKIGIGVPPLNTLDAAGGAAIGAYAGANAAPANGLIVSGNVGIGTNTPSQPFEVNGTAKAANFKFGDSTTQSTAGVAKTGDTMTGALNLPANGLAVGTNQLVVSGGNVTANGSVTAASFSGNGSALSGVITAVNTTAGSGLTGGVTSGAANLALTAAARTRVMTYLGGCDTCSALTDADSQHMIYDNLIGAMTINSITCFSDAGTPTINIARNGTNILSSNLTCSPTGATNSSFVVSQNAMSLNDKLDFVMIGAGGAAKRVTVSIVATLN